MVSRNSSNDSDSIKATVIAGALGVARRAKKQAKAMIVIEPRADVTNLLDMELAALSLALNAATAPDGPREQWSSQ